MNKNIFDSLYKKYHIVLKKQFNYDVGKNMSQTFWQFKTDKKENLFDMTKFCNISIKKFLPSENYIQLNMNNLDKYLNLPKYVLKKWNNGIIRDEQLSEIIRCAILTKYGGTWLDNDIILTKEIDNDILSAPLYIMKVPSYYTDSDFSFFNYLQNFGNIFSLKNPLIPSNSWLIHSKQNHHLMRYTLALLLEYWKNEDKNTDNLFEHFSLMVSTAIDDGLIS